MALREELVKVLLEFEEFVEEHKYLGISSGDYTEYVDKILTVVASQLQRDSPVD